MAKYAVMGGNMTIMYCDYHDTQEDAENKASRLGIAHDNYPYTICELVPVKTIAAPAPPKERWAIVDKNGDLSATRLSLGVAEAYAERLNNDPEMPDAPYRVFKLEFKEA